MTTQVLNFETVLYGISPFIMILYGISTFTLYVFIVTTSLLLLCWMSDSPQMGCV